MANRYAPTSLWRGRAAAHVAGVAAGVAIACAVAGHLAARVYAFLLVLPAAQGAAIGLACAWAIRRARFSHGAAALTIAAAAAVGALAGQTALDFATARAAHVRQCTELRDLRLAVGASDVDVVAGDFRACRAEMTFGPFLARRVGLADGTPTATDRGASLGSSTGALIAAVLELLVATGIAGWLARAAAREPICPACGAWRVERAVGRAAQGAGPAVVDALLAGDRAAVTAALQPPDTREETRLALMSCPDGHDNGGGVLRIEDQRIDRQRRTIRAPIADLVVSPAEVRCVTEALDG